MAKEKKTALKKNYTFSVTVEDDDGIETLNTENNRRYHVSWCATEAAARKRVEEEIRLYTHLGYRIIGWTVSNRTRVIDEG
jgi:hypothetical protein